MVESCEEEFLKFDLECEQVRLPAQTLSPPRGKKCKKMKGSVDDSDHGNTFGMF